MSNNADYIGTLEAAILIQHECGCTHTDSVFVQERTEDGQIVWRGDVERFELIGHPEARSCFAWQHLDGRGHSRIVTVIATPFIDSPRRAVQVAIFADAQPVGVRFSSELEVLRWHIQECRDLLRKARIKVEDLAASIHTAEGITDFIRETRNVQCGNGSGEITTDSPSLKLRRIKGPAAALARRSDEDQCL